MVSASNNFAHCTQFMINQREFRNSHHVNTLQSEIATEPNFDLAFAEAAIKAFNSPALKKSDNLLTLLDTIQDVTLNHLSQSQINSNLSDVEKIYFSRTAFSCSEEGLRELIRRIWCDKLHLKLTVITNDQNDFKKEKIKKLKYQVDQKKFTYHSGDKTHLIYKNEESNQDKNLQKIYQKCLPFFQKDDLSIPLSKFLSYKLPRIQLKIKGTKEEKEATALKTVDVFCEKIHLAATEDEKIKLVAEVVQDLNISHRSVKTNARCACIFANTLLQKLHIAPFYLENMSLFEANSINEICKAIRTGQEVFQEKFGSLEKLSQDFSAYKITMLQLMEKLLENPLHSMTNSCYPLNKQLRAAFERRNMNLFFRLTATYPVYLELLQFSLENAQILNIDLFSRGEKSGNALKIAQDRKNQQGAELLKTYYEKFSENI